MDRGGIRGPARFAFVDSAFVSWALLGVLIAGAAEPAGPRQHAARPAREGGQVLLVGLGDSLTHGTMDATNNSLNTLNAYLQRVADSLATVLPLSFSQPLYDFDESRIDPFVVPSNLGIDGADLFSIEGWEYYKRVGADQNYLSDTYFCDHVLPARFADDTDKVLYPLNLLARADVTLVDAAVERINEHLDADPANRALLMYWIGNNDSSLASLGQGGSNPSVYPLPYEQIRGELAPLLRLLIDVAVAQDVLTFEPYTLANIERNLTELDDFAMQNTHVLDRLQSEVHDPQRVDTFVMTLPYYSSVGYLFDSDDLEFYMQKLDPAYSVPASFARVAPPGAPIDDPRAGDRASLFTFGPMFALLSTGYSSAYANAALETDGVQNDGLVMSEAEAAYIAARIDTFNQAIAADAATRGSNVHLVDVGSYINAGFSGELEIIIGGKTLSRKWVRGSGFSLDGVHPAYAGAAMLANYVLESVNSALGLAAPTYDLDAISTTDPYIDRDDDGWAPGPDYGATGFTELLFLFRDPDDTSAGVQVDLPDDVWEIISQALLDSLRRSESVRALSSELGLPGRLPHRTRR